MGSASAAELDGSSLAMATNSIISIVQYRLGAVSVYDSVLLALIIF